MFTAAEVNAPSARLAATGMSDARLAAIGYISVLWNGLERNLVACIWVAADWPEDLGEIVTADLGNVSRAELLMNLIKQFIPNDPKIIDQANETLKLCDHLRGIRNRLIHGFFNWRHLGLSDDDNLVKFTAKKRSGYAKMELVQIDQLFLEELAADIALCSEFLNDLTHKIHFRKQFRAEADAEHLHTYDESVHGWREPSLDISLLRECLKKRSAPPRP
jgi:hypothetical protein